MPQMVGRLPQSQHLRMGRRIRQGLPLVMSTPNNAIVNDHDSANRHFSALQGQAGFL